MTVIPAIVGVLGTVPKNLEKRLDNLEIRGSTTKISLNVEVFCLHPVNVLSLSCFYRESLLLRRFLLVGRMLVGCVPSSLCEWNQRPW